MGTAKTLYLGQLAIDTEFYSSATLYGMVDRLRGNAYTTDMNGKQVGSGTLFPDADNTLGNFTNSDRATAGTDAHLGMAFTWDYFQNVHGRNGIYNDGIGAYSRVHYGRNYNNAFWSDCCKCMTYGDGDGSVLSPPASLDVAGHEMSHGVTSATANLQYSGESGGLNESNSDIFGTAVEFYANNPNDPPDWWIGETVYTPNKSGDALRYMDDPKKDGRSVDHYSLYANGRDVHYSSGIANNFFYLLVHGGTNRTSGISVTGMGLAKAERIWYVALTGYMNSTTNFSQARQATIQAATQLFGASSVEVQRVKDAWTAVGVNGHKAKDRKKGPAAAGPFLLARVTQGPLTGHDQGTVTLQGRSKTNLGGRAHKPRDFVQAGKQQLLQVHGVPGAKFDHQIVLACDEVHLLHLGDSRERTNGRIQPGGQVHANMHQCGDRVAQGVRVYVDRKAPHHTRCPQLGEPLVNRSRCHSYPFGNGGKWHTSVFLQRRKNFSVQGIQYHSL